MRVFIGFVITTVLLSAFLLFKPAKIEYDLTELNEEAILYTKDMKFSSDVSFELINFVYKNKLTLVKEFKEKDFIASEFEDWQEFQHNYYLIRELDFKKEPLVKLNSYLLQDSKSNYHIIINYEHNNNLLTVPKIRLDFSKRYEVVNGTHYSSLVFKDLEYNLNFDFGYSLGDNRYPITSSKLNNKYKRSKTKGFYHFEFSAKSNLFTDYFSLRVDYFEAYQVSSNKVLFGFNAFGNKKSNKIIAKSYEVKFKEEK